MLWIAEGAAKPRHGGLKGLDGERCDLIVELAAEGGILPGRRNRRDDCAVTLADEAERFGRQVGERRAHIERPPAVIPQVIDGAVRGRALLFVATGRLRRCATTTAGSAISPPACPSNLGSTGQPRKRPANAHQLPDAGRAQGTQIGGQSAEDRPEFGDGVASLFSSTKFGRTCGAGP